MNTKRKAATVAASLAVAFAGAGWAGCGSDEDDVTDAINNASEEAQQQAEEIQDEVNQAVEEAGGDAEEIQKEAEEAAKEAQDQADQALEDAGY